MKKVIFLLLDGARFDILDELLGSNSLPNLSSIIKSGSYSKAVSVFPSTTGPAYIPFLMGQYPGNVNLPGIRWLDKVNFSKNPFSTNANRSYVGYENKFFNDDIKKSFKTIFNYLPNSVSIFNEITSGLNARNDLTSNSKIFYKLLSHFFGSSLIDKIAFKKLINSFDNKKQFYFCCLYGIDSLSHIQGSDTESIKQLYKSFDNNLGKLRNFLEDKSTYDDTLIIITSDHGHSNTFEHFDLVEYLKSKNKSIFYYPLTFKKLYKKFDSSVMVSGNSMAHVYLNSNFNWSKPFSFSQHEELINDLISQDAVDIISYKNPKGDIIILSSRGKSLISDKESSIYYQPLENDPFDYSISEGLYDENQLLDLTYETNYPDAIIQLLQIFRSKRCGDLVLSANPGWDFRKKFEIPLHKSSHGSLRKEHMIVPLILNKKINNISKIRTVDIYNTMLEFLGIKSLNAIEGKKLDIY